MMKGKRIGENIVYHTRKSTVIATPHNGVLKTYKPEFAHCFEAQSTAARVLSNLDPTLYVIPEKTFPEELAFKSQYAGENIEELVINNGLSQDLPKKIVDAMATEVKLLDGVEHPDLQLHPYIGPEKYEFTNRLISGNHLSEKEKSGLLGLLAQDDGRSIRIRVDPEASNYTLNGNESLRIVDWAYFRNGHPLYVPAYFMVHLENPRQAEFEEYTNQIKSEMLQQLEEISDQFVDEPNSFKPILALNMIEVNAYLYLSKPLQASQNEEIFHGQTKWLNTILRQLELITPIIASQESIPEYTSLEEVIA